MADAPSPIAASSLPSAFRVTEAAKERDSLRAAEVDAARRQVRTLDEIDGAVETTDADVQIFGDAEGTGSQGRNQEDASHQPKSDEASACQGEFIFQDDDGHEHVDIEA